MEAIIAKAFAAPAAPASNPVNDKIMEMVVERAFAPREEPERSSKEETKLEEIDSVVKESLMDNQEEYEEEDLDAAPEAGLEPEMGGGEDLGLDAGAEGGMEDVTGLEDIEGSEEVEPEMGPELGMDVDTLGGDEMDMTASSDDEVIAIYKKLSGEDEIEIVGDEIHMTVSEPGEYIVKMNGGSPEGAGLADDELDLDGEGEFGGEEGGVDYEIEMNDDEEEEETPEHEAGESPEFEAGEEESSEEETENPEEEEEETVDENLGHQRGYAGRQGQKMHGAAHLPEDKETIKEVQAAKKLVSETTAKYNALLTEAKKLQNENEEFRTALSKFRTQLLETVVLNANLSYVARIITEHSTTRAEKEAIVKRFDTEVTNLKESKLLFKSIVNQLESRKPISESVENKLIKEATTGSSKQLTESTAYVDPSTKRIIDLMKRVG
jgi:hypothetical protein